MTDPSATLKVRPAIAADARVIAEVVKESWLAANRGLLPADTARQIAHSDRLGAFVSQQWPSIWVATLGGHIVGTAGVNTEGHLWMLYVLPGHQGQGIGSALYDAALGAIRSTGKRKAMLEVLAANEQAVAFYRARGWVPEGRRTEHIPGFRFTALRMGLALA